MNMFTKIFFQLFILILHVFLASCCRQKVFNDFGVVVWSGNSFDKVAGPFQISDRFSFL